MADLQPRRLAFEVLRRTEEEGAFADLALDAALRSSPALDPRDRALATELVYGVLRLRGRLDFALGRFSRKPLEKLEPGVLRLLRLGAYQLLELDRIPPHAAVHTSVELARKVGLGRASGLVNGLLRNLDRKRESLSWPGPESLRAYLESWCSLPGWLAGELLRQFPGEEARAFGEALAAPAPQTLRINTLRTDREQFLAALGSTGWQARPCRYASEGVTIEARGEGMLPGQEEGWFQVQDQASMLVPHLLGARSGERLLDACAAPGGKTTQLAALAGNGAQILALDKHPRRVELVRRGAARLGCRGIEARAWDLCSIPGFLAPGSFDRVLVDAPCSGLGVLRRNPEIRWRRRPEDLAGLADLQRTLLGNVADLVRPGGVLVYSVCTFTREETDGVVAGFLEDRGDFRREPLGPLLPESWSALFDAEGALRSFPHRHDGMDAFFALRLRREGSAAD